MFTASSIITIISLLFGCGITVIVLGVTGFFLFRIFKNMGQNNALLKSGVSAPAVILQADDTGTTMNDSPQVRLTLQVNPPGQPPFQAVTTTFVGRLQVGLIMPGMSATVRYDPVNPSKVAIETLNGAAGGSAAPGNTAQLQAQLEAQDRANQLIIQMGQPATAKVLNVTDMNVRVNEVASMLRMDLEVTGSDGIPFRAQTQAAVLDTSRPKYAVGNTVYVKYNPNDKTQVAIDHS